jgi:hypothetical protein
VGVASLPPRLLTLRDLGAYLGIGERRARDLVSSGQIPRVEIPLARGTTMRKVLVDRETVDRLVVAWQERLTR